MTYAALCDLELENFSLEWLFDSLIPFYTTKPVSCFLWQLAMLMNFVGVVPKYWGVTCLLWP